MKSQSLPRFGNVFYLTSIAAACFLLLFGLATIIFGTRTYDVQITQDVRRQPLGVRLVVDRER